MDGRGIATYDDASVDVVDSQNVIDPMDVLNGTVMQSDSEDYSDEKDEDWGGGRNTHLFLRFWPTLLAAPKGIKKDKVKKGAKKKGEKEKKPKQEKKSRKRHKSSDEEFEEVLVELPLVLIFQGELEGEAPQPKRRKVSPETKQTNPVVAPPADLDAGDSEFDDGLDDDLRGDIEDRK